MQVNLYDAKTRLSELVEQAHLGQTVTIAKAGTPMAKLVPLQDGIKRKIKFGSMKGQFEIPAGFDDTLSDAELALWGCRIKP